MMKNSIIRAAAILAAALVLAPAAGAADKNDKTEKNDKKEVHRWVVVKDGKVITSDGASKEDFVWATSPRGYLGVQLTELTPELREHFRVSKDAGVLVAKIVADSPAAKAGLRVGDIITAVDGAPVDTPSDVTRAVREKKKGDSVRLDYSRDGANATAVATVDQREVREVDLRDFNIRIPEIDMRDFRVPEIPKQLNEYFSSPQWKAKMERMQNLPDCSQLDAKMKELDKKMKELEKKLSQK